MIFHWRTIQVDAYLMYYFTSVWDIYVCDFTGTISITRESQGLCLAAVQSMNNKVMNWSQKIPTSSVYISIYQTMQIKSWSYDNNSALSLTF